jgi:hypothetical protein
MLLVKAKKYRTPVVETQISQYWQTHNRYLCISIAKPLDKDCKEAVSVTIGLLIDQNLIHTMPFVNHPDITVRTVHTTCERCGIMDCLERAEQPIVIAELQSEYNMLNALKLLN